MVKVSIKETAELNVSADIAWEIIGPSFVSIGKWGRGIKKSWENNELPITIADAPAGGRFCDLGKFGIADERIIHYDKINREISWSAQVEKMPGFVENLKNSLFVDALDENTSVISSNITADLVGLKGSLLGGPIKSSFSKQLKGFISDWKIYAETGKISDYKLNELTKG